MTGKQLRNSILQWAIQGKLVPQDPNDEPASVLLERIRAEKAHLVKEKKIKRDKNESIIYRGEDNSYYEKTLATGAVRCIDDEIPFDIPQGWEWERWGNVSFSIQYGYNAPAIENGDVRMVRISDIQDNKVLWQGVPFCNIAAQEIPNYILEPNDILFARTGGTVGKSFLVESVPVKAIYAGYLIRTRYSNELSPLYLKSFMESSLYWEQLRTGTIATAQPNCNGKTLGKMLLPIPPKDEQKRIVSKLTELTSLIENYRVVEFSFRKLNDSINESLKKSILQEAIQGRLVPQIKSEGTAEDLLEEIRAEKKRLIKEGGKLKKSAIANESRIFRGDDNRYYEQIGSDTIDISDLLPFTLPDNWRWCRLSNVIQLLSGRDLEPTEYNDSKLGIPYMTGASNFSNEKLLVNRWTERPVTISVIGDLLITCKGTIGQMAFNSIGEIHIARQIMAIRGIVISLEYIMCFLETMLNSLQKQAKSMIPGISREVILNALLPLPPLDEQIRIVKCIKAISKSL